MAAEILRGVIELDRPCKVGSAYVLLERTKTPNKFYFRLATSRRELQPPRQKRLTSPPKQA